MAGPLFLLVAIVDIVRKDKDGDRGRDDDGGDDDDDDDDDDVVVVVVHKGDKSTKNTKSHKSKSTSTRGNRNTESKGKSGKNSKEQQNDILKFESKYIEKTTPLQLTCPKGTAH